MSFVPGAIIDFAVATVIGDQILANAVGGEWSARSVGVVLTNDTDQPLNLRGKGTTHGIWSHRTKILNEFGGPPDTIPPRKAATWMAESDGIATGTEGGVWYGIGDTGDHFAVNFNNPYFGKNHFDCPETFNTGRFIKSWSYQPGNNAWIRVKLSMPL
jgi:hypothetical protein